MSYMRQRLELILPLTGAQDKSSSSSTLKTQALLFLRSAMASSDAAAFQPSLSLLLPPVLAAVAERYYKVCTALSHSTTGANTLPKLLKLVDSRNE